MRREALRDAAAEAEKDPDIIFTPDGLHIENFGISRSAQGLSNEQPRKFDSFRELSEHQKALNRQPSNPVIQPDNGTGHDMQQAGFGENVAKKVFKVNRKTIPTSPSPISRRKITRYSTATRERFVKTLTVFILRAAKMKEGDCKNPKWLRRCASRKRKTCCERMVLRSFGKDNAKDTDKRRS